jgi:hypothetical protein
MSEPDDVPVVDPLLLLAAQARHRLGQLAAVTRLHEVGVLADFNLASD